MGHIYHDVEISVDKATTVRMCVDTGATFSMISPALAKQIGVKPAKKKHRVVLADGRVIRLPVGLAFFRIDGREAANTVLIGRVAEPILGVEALEALGYAADPTTGRLQKTRSYGVRLGGYR